MVHVFLEYSYQLIRRYKMKLSETIIISSAFDIDQKKYKKNVLLNKLSYWAFKTGWLRSRIF